MSQKGQDKFVGYDSLNCFIYIKLRDWCYFLLWKCFFFIHQICTEYHFPALQDLSWHKNRQHVTCATSFCCLKQQSTANTYNKSHKVYTKWKGAGVLVLVCVCVCVYRKINRDKDMGKGRSLASVLIGLIRQLLGKVKL